jgi:hypothetical protein
MHLEEFVHQKDLQMEEGFASINSQLKVISEMKDKFDQFTKSFEKFTEAFDNSAESIKLRNQNKLKVAFDKSHYFDNLAVLRTWRANDPNFAVFAAYQSRWRKDNRSSGDLRKLNEMTSDVERFTFEKFTELCNAFREIKGFMDTARTLAKEEINGQKIDMCYLSKDDFFDLLGLRRPHIYDFLDLVQHIDKVNGNCTGLMMENKKSSWIKHRPGLYEWIERVWGFKCVRETAYVDDNLRVLYEGDGENVTLEEVHNRHAQTCTVCSSQVQSLESGKAVIEQLKNELTHQATLGRKSLTDSEKKHDEKMRKLEVENVIWKISAGVLLVAVSFGIAVVYKRR